MNPSSDVRYLLSKIRKHPIDKTVPRDRLNLVNRGRTSLFPWRGQFSPELVELLLTRYASPDSVVLDPFVGSGTTLFEAARQSLACIGSEINPAAVEMARTILFTNMNRGSRNEYVHKAEIIIRKYLRQSQGATLFSFEEGPPRTGISIQDVFRSMLAEASKEDLIHSIVVNSLLRYVAMAKRERARPDGLLRAFRIHKEIIENLPCSKKPCKIFQCDARALPIDDETVDLIVTSPPYINVFNYHQQYRKVMELAGWDLLKVAKSEIGSNRKNRGNRFLTVVQYSIDMLQALNEMRRALRRSGRIVIVIGRESTIRGVRFENYRILCALAMGGAGLKMMSRQERKFVTRFGETIYEDLLHFTPSDEQPIQSDDFARSIGVYFLKKAKRPYTKDVRQDILSATRDANSTRASPILSELDRIMRSGSM